MDDFYPIQMFNPVNAYELLSDGYYIEGIYLMLLSPLFIGIGEGNIKY